MTTLRFNANLSLYFFILFLGLLNCWFLYDALRYKIYIIFFQPISPKTNLIFTSLTEIIRLPLDLLLVSFFNFLDRSSRRLIGTTFWRLFCHSWLRVAKLSPNSVPGSCRSKTECPCTAYSRVWHCSIFQLYCYLLEHVGRSV